VKTKPAITQCREPNCRKVILLALTRYGNWQPLDFPPHLMVGEAGGEIVLVGLGSEARAVVLSADDLRDGQPRYRYMPHAATCVARKTKHAAA
jgi:hypothetical protein